MITRNFLGLKKIFSYIKGCLSALFNIHGGGDAKPVDTHQYEHSLYVLGSLHTAFIRCCIYLGEADW